MTAGLFDYLHSSHRFKLCGKRQSAQVIHVEDGTNVEVAQSNLLDWYEAIFKHLVNKFAKVRVDSHWVNHISSTEQSSNGFDVVSDLFHIIEFYMN